MQIPKSLYYALGAGALSCLVLTSCGNDEPLLTGRSDLGANLGGYNLSCQGQSSGKQKQVQFQQQQSYGCKQQPFQYAQKQAASYDVNLDCGKKQVIVANQGMDQKQQALPIQSDGSVKGSVQYQQQVQSDGKGSQVCWVQYEVEFDGKARCGGGGGYSGSSRGQPQNYLAGPDEGSLSLTTTIHIQPSSDDLLLQAGISSRGDSLISQVRPSPRPSPWQHPGQNPDQDPDQSPGQNPGDQHPGWQNPGQNPGQDPGQDPGGHHPGHGDDGDNGHDGDHHHSFPRPDDDDDDESEFDHSGHHQHHRHRPERPVPSLVCVVENPCPMTATADMSCNPYP